MRVRVSRLIFLALLLTAGGYFGNQFYVVYTRSCSGDACPCATVPPSDIVNRESASNSGDKEGIMIAVLTSTPTRARAKSLKNMWMEQQFKGMITFVSEVMDDELAIRITQYGNRKEVKFDTLVASQCSNDLSETAIVCKTRAFLEKSLDLYPDKQWFIIVLDSAYVRLQRLLKDLSTMSTASPVIVGSDRFLAITDACAPVSSAHLEQPYSSQTSAALFKDPPTKTHVVGYSHAHAGWAINRHAATLLAANMGHWEDILKAPGLRGLSDATFGAYAHVLGIHFVPLSSFVGGDDAKDNHRIVRASIITPFRLCGGPGEGE